ncbi:MAG: heme o synthase [bacterium]|nr:heme o synthase [bacterium]
MVDLRGYIPLFKMRIAFLITFSAIVGALSATTSGKEIIWINIVLLCVAMMMGAAGSGAFNHYIDRDIDLKMGRTNKRPLTTGIITSTRSVFWMASLLIVMALSLTTVTLNYVVTLHLFLGAFVYVVLYTAWLKRKSWTNILIGGLSGSFAVLAGAASVNPEMCALPLILALVMFFWTPSHFWSFAIVHKEDYRKAGVPMLPVVIGDKKTAVYILINTIFLVASSFLPVYFGHLGIFYAVAAAASGGYFILKNIQLLAQQSSQIAWQNFKASMYYLAILFSAVIFDILLS